MAFVLFPVIQFTDDNGAALASGDVLTYVGGTTTPAATYSNSTGTAAANPVPLDASGRPNNGTGLWLDSTVTYKFIIRDSNDNELQTIDNYAAAGGDLTQLATNVSFVTLGATSLLASERVLTAGSGISLTDAGAGSTLTAAVNINGLTEDTNPDTDTDLIPTYDSSAAANRKVKLVNLLKSLPTVAGKLYMAGDNRQSANYIANVTGTTAVSVDTVYYVPIIFSRNVTLSSIVCYLHTEHVGSNLRLGIYAASASTLLPTGAALVDSGNISTTGTGQKSYATSQSLTANTLYYLAFNTASSTIRATLVSGLFPGPLYVPGETAMTGVTRGTYAFSQASAFGAFPTVSGPTAINGTSTACPLIGVVLA